MGGYLYINIKELTLHYNLQSAHKPLKKREGRKRSKMIKRGKRKIMLYRYQLDHNTILKLQIIELLTYIDNLKINALNEEVK